MKGHCVVIGAGIIGASCAWHLQRKGLQVTLIDPVLPGQSRYNFPKMVNMLKLHGETRMLPT